MEYFCYSLVAIVVLYALGLGFTIFLLPESLRRYTLILAPWIGYCYVGLACWPVFYYGGKIGPGTSRIIVLAPVLSLIIELVRRRRPNLRHAIMSGPTLGALAIAGVGFVVVSIPVFWTAGRLTTVSLGNNDIAAFGAIARYLSEFARNSTEGFVGQLPFELGAKEFYFGPPAFAAFVGRLLGLMPHQDLSLCVFLLFALDAALIFIFLYDTLQLSTGWALFGVAFVGFHPMNQFIALEGFLPQIVGTGFALLIFWTDTKLLENKSWNVDTTKLWLLLTLFTCGLLLNYPHMLLFVWPFAGVYLIVSAFLERSLHGIKICAVANILAVLATAMILPQRIGSFLRLVMSYTSVEAGWFIPWMAPHYVIGLMYKNPFLELVEDWRVHLTLSVLVTLVLVYAMYVAHRSGFRRIVTLGFACAAVYAGGFLFAIMEQKDGILGGYRSFKLVSSFLPFFGATVVSLAAVVKTRYRRIDLAVKLVAAAAVITSYAMADRVMLQPGRFLRVEPQYESLRGLERAKSVQSINVIADDYWPTLWAAYFLMHKTLYLAHQSYYGTSELVGEYDLEDNVSSRSQIVHVKPIDTATVARLNERFTLVGPLRRRIRAKLGVGWHLGEIGHVWSGKDGKRASIILHSLNDGVKVCLTLICSPLRRDDRLTLQFHGNRLNPTIDYEADGDEEIKVSELVLNKGDNEVDIISELDPIPPSASDPRPVSHLFTSVEIDELPPAQAPASATGLDAMADQAASVLRGRQSAAGYWLTSYTSGMQFEAPQAEMNTFLTAMMVDFLSPIAREHSLDETVARARLHLAAQIESNGLVRYHGLPNAPTINTLGYVITPDADDTALAWRIAGGNAADARREPMLKELAAYRDSRGLYRTWLAPREQYQSLNPGRDPNPADATIQMHVYLMLRELDPPAAQSLCSALQRSIGNDDLWVYYAKAPLIPYLRSAELRQRDCAVPLPTDRLAHSAAGQEVWSEVARRLVATMVSPPSPSDRQAMFDLLARIGNNDFAELRRAPPLLYHNDLTATVPRYYWSEDFGYALWLRLYDAARSEAILRR